MTDKNQREGVVVLKDVRLSFPRLFTPTASIENGPLKYRAAFLIDPETASGKENIKKLEAAISKAAVTVWKTKEKADKIRAKLDNARTGLQDGENATNKDGDVYSGYEGMQFIKASNGRKPKVLRRDKTVIDSSEAAEIYGGCYVNAVVSIWATDSQKRGGNGIFATLEIVQFARKGEPFGATELDEDDYLEDMGDEEDGDDLV